MFEIIGAMLGVVAGFFGPMLFAQLYVVRGGDPTAAGGLFIVCFITIPAGIVIGGLMGFLLRLWIRRSK